MTSASRLLAQACLITGAAAALAGCSDITGPESAAAQIKAPAAKAIGEPQTCIPVRRIKETTVHDDYTIDFELNGGKIYRNTLSARCGGLDYEEAFTYSTSLTQLCRADIITVISTTGPGIQPRGSCGLNSFQQIELIEDDAD